MSVEVQVVNAFVDGDTGGNPAGVVVDADALTALQKQSIARQVGLSETAFVSASNTATVKPEFFTPTRQIPHCGHATVATFSLLRQRGLIGEGRLSKETIEGDRHILVDGNRVYMEQRAPHYHFIEPSSELAGRVAASLGLDVEVWREGPAPCVANTGMNFLLVPLANGDAVAALRPELAQVESVSEALDLVGYFAFSTQPEVAGRHAGARMFAPRFGIAEEAATGMAAGPLACFLHDHLAVRAPEFLIEQGRLMRPPSPSVIHVAVETAGGRASGLMAGGAARVVSSYNVAP